MSSLITIITSPDKPPPKILPMPFTTEAARWRALSIRDPTANGHFLYTVKSTHVYCRPTCPARLARRANIGFCKTPAEAEAAGYRACKRCKPNEEITEDPQAKAVAKTCRLIEEAVQRGDEKAIRLQELAKSVGLTPRYFHKVFKDKTGLTPKEYAKAKGRGAGGAGTDPFLHEDLDVLELSNVDTFEFNDLVDFDTDASLFTQPTPPSATLEPYMPGVFGSEIAVNVESAMGVSWPDLASGRFGVDDAGLFQQMDVNPSSAKATMATTKTTTVFEADAALLFSGGTFLEFNGSMYRDMFA
jgi:methylphosphotriester-DNA--protein-cysteine methyltransferase